MRNGRIDVPVRMRMRIIERSSWGNLCSLKKTIETRVQFRQVQIKSFDLYGILYTTYTYVVAPDEAALVIFRHEGLGLRQCQKVGHILRLESVLLEAA